MVYLLQFELGSPSRRLPCRSLQRINKVRTSIFAFFISGLARPSIPAAQAFQVSDQAVRLLQDGWFQPQEQPSGESKLRNPKVPP